MRIYKVDMGKASAPQIREYLPGSQMDLKFGEEGATPFVATMQAVFVVESAQDHHHRNPGTVRVLTGVLRHGEKVARAQVSYYPNYHHIVILTVDAA